MFLAHYLETRDPGIAVGRTADVVYSVLKATTDAGSSELLLVGAQDEIVNPSHHFEVQQIR
jgi:pyridoxine kinase